MLRRNPYLPPQAPLADAEQTISVRGDFGLRLSGSLFWRALLFQYAVAFTLSLAMNSLSDGIIRWKFTVLYSCLALLLTLSLLVEKPGALFFIWGQRLGLPLAAWRRFSWMLICLYLALAAASISLAFTASNVTWVQFKVFVPLPSFVVICAIAPRFLRRVA